MHVLAKDYVRQALGQDWNNLCDLGGRTLVCQGLQRWSPYYSDKLNCDYCIIEMVHPLSRSTRTADIRHRTSILVQRIHIIWQQNGLQTCHLLTMAEKVVSTGSSGSANRQGPLSSKHSLTGTIPSDGVSAQNTLLPTTTAVRQPRCNTSREKHTSSYYNRTAHTYHHSRKEWQLRLITTNKQVG